MFNPDREVAQEAQMTQVKLVILKINIYIQIQRIFLCAQHIITGPETLWYRLKRMRNNFKQCIWTASLSKVLTLRSFWEKQSVKGFLSFVLLPFKVIFPYIFSFRYGPVFWSSFFLPLSLTCPSFSHVSLLVPPWLCLFPSSSKSWGNLHLL